MTLQHTEPTDADLVRSVQEGDDAAFAVLVQRHRAMLFNFVKRKVRDDGTAEEVTQDAFVNAHRALPNFRGDSNFKTWLYRIAGNLAYNRYWYFFRRKRHLMDSMQAPIGEGMATMGDTVPADMLSIQREAELSELSEAAMAAIKELPDCQREILELRIAGLAYHEIADALKVEIGTVKSRIARARASLRKNVNKSAPEAAAIFPERLP